MQVRPWLLMFFAVASPMQATIPPAPRADRVDLALSIAGEAPLPPREAYVLELGGVPPGQSDVRIAVTNLGAERVVSAISEAPHVQVRWENNTNDHAAWVATLAANGAGTLVVSVNHTAALSEHAPVILSDPSGPILTIWPDYLLVGEPTKFITFNAGELNSGNGKAFNNPPYTFCSGPAPAGYRYVQRDHEVHVSGRERHCGFYAECKPAGRSDANVCWTVSVQGDEAHNGEPDEIERFRAVLKVEYTLDRTAPRLH